MKKKSATKKRRNRTSEWQKKSRVACQEIHNKTLKVGKIWKNVGQTSWVVAAQCTVLLYSYQDWKLYQ